MQSTLGEFLDNYMKINVVPEIQRVNGVGDVMSFGADYSMRIWLKPEVMAQYHLMPSDISAALAEQNVEAAPVHSASRATSRSNISCATAAACPSPEEFGNIVVRTGENGEVLYLKDVAEIELGRVTYGFGNKYNGKLASMAIVFRRHPDLTPQRLSTTVSHWSTNSRPICPRAAPLRYL